MKSFLQRRDPWGHGYPLWLIAAIVFLMPFMGWSLSKIRMENDVAGWLPRNDPQSRILEWYHELFPSEERILVSWDDCTLTDERMQKMAIALEGVEKSGKREGGSPYIGDVKLPTDLIQKMMEEDVPFETALERTNGLLTGPGPLCIRLTDAGRLRGEYMQSEILELANREFQLNAEIVDQSLAAPTSDGLSLDNEWGWKVHDASVEYVKSRPLFDFQLRWPRMHIDAEKTERFREALKQIQAPDAPVDSAVTNCIDDSFYVQGSMAALSVGLSETGEADAKEAIADIIEAASAAGIPASSLHMGGRPVASSELNKAVKHAGWNREFPIWNLFSRSPILLSVLITFGLTYFMLRSFRLTVLVQLVAVFCAIAAVSLVPAFGGSMNMVLVVMPTLLMVLTTSGAIHLCNYWKHSGISGVAESVHYASRVAWMPCFLASGTTAIGFGSLVVSSLIPVRDFGIYAAIGCLISFGFVLYLLPSLMLYWPQVPPKSESLNVEGWKHFGAGLAKYNVVVCFSCLLLTVGTGWGLTRFRTETKVIRYFPDESRVAQDYYFLEENLSGIVSVDTIVRFDEATQQQIPFMDRARRVMEIQKSLSEHPEVSGTLSLASFLNLNEVDTSKMSRMERMQHKRKESLIGDRIHEKVIAGGEQARGLSSMIAVAQASHDWMVEGDEKLHRKGDEIWRITCQSSIMSDYDYSLLTKELDEITRKHLASIGSPGTTHIVTGLIPIFLRTQEALLESLISSLGLAFLIIGVVVAVLLRSTVASFWAMLPNMMPVVQVFGLICWGGIRVDIGTMITASVALGIAVDGTLHLITWFQILVRQGIPKNEAVAKALSHCGPALWQTSAAVGLGMLALYPVELLLISRFGWIMAAMIFAALFGDVVLLPALLGGPLGNVLIRIEEKRKAKGADTAPKGSENPGPDEPKPKGGSPLPGSKSVVVSGSEGSPAAVENRSATGSPGASHPSTTPAANSPIPSGGHPHWNRMSSNRAVPPKESR